VDELLRMVEEELGVAEGSLEPDSAVADFEEWDSLTVLMVASRVQERFGASILSEQLGDVRTVRDLWGLIERGRQ
jgi:acyl carrier protein